jgi:phosphoserine aminotransferase
VGDMSSNILSEVYDVSKFGIIYAGAQKNIAPAGVTIAIIRQDLIGKALPVTPTMLNYQVHAGEKSLYNTPPCYCIYIAKLVFDWIMDLGGVAAVQKMNEAKAALIYDFLDNSAMFKGTVDKEFRSLMNIPFTSPTEESDKLFVKEATAAGLVNLKGHRSVGGMRASIYNAMPMEGVKKLVDFMKAFELKNKK